MCSVKLSTQSSQNNLKLFRKKRNTFITGTTKFPSWIRLNCGYVLQAKKVGLTELRSSTSTNVMTWCLKVTVGCSFTVQVVIHNPEIIVYSISLLNTPLRLLQDNKIMIISNLKVRDIWCNVKTIIQYITSYGLVHIPFYIYLKFSSMLWWLKFFYMLFTNIY